MPKHTFFWIRENLVFLGEGVVGDSGGGEGTCTFVANYHPLSVRLQVVSIFPQG